LYLTAGSPTASMIGHSTEPPPGLHIVDVTIPQQNREVGFFATPDQYPRDVAVTDGYAYLLTLTWQRDLAARTIRADLQIVDVSNPGTPVQVASYALAASRPERVLVADGRAYVAGGSTLQILDVTDPAHPVGLASHQVAGGIRGLVVVSQMVYAAAGSGGLAVLRWE